MFDCAVYVLEVRVSSTYMGACGNARERQALGFHLGLAGDDYVFGLGAQIMLHIEYLLCAKRTRLNTLPGSACISVLHIEAREHCVLH